jgi:PPOX class probable F420-dependent enzyme
MKNVPASHLDLLEDKARAYAFLATTMPDGSPQITTVWFSVEGDHILINSNKGRVKDRNMRARPHVAALLMKPADPYHYLQVRGEVIEITQEGAVDHIHQLSRKYSGNDFNLPSSHVRVIYKIKPNSWTPYSF